MLQRGDEWQRTSCTLWMCHVLCLHLQIVHCEQAQEGLCYPNQANVLESTKTAIVIVTKPYPSEIRCRGRLLKGDANPHNQISLLYVFFHDVKDILRGYDIICIDTRKLMSNTSSGVVPSHALTYPTDVKYILWCCDVICINTHKFMSKTSSGVVPSCASIHTSSCQRHPLV